MKLRTIIFSLLFLTSSLCAQVPEWVYEPYSEYSKASHLVAVGEGKTRDEAESNAFGNISRVFGTSVNVDTRSQVRYNQNAVTRQSTQNTGLSSSHNLINCSILENHHDAEMNTHYALAMIPRNDTALMIVRTIQDNEEAIEMYLMDAEYESDLLYKFSYLDMAAILAEQNDVLMNQYAVLQNSIISQMQELTSYNARQLRAQARSVARGMTFSVQIEDNSIVQTAIESAISSLDMRVNRTNPTYVFSVNIGAVGTDTGFGMYVFNYVTNIELLDSSGTLVTSFSYKGREGGRTEADAVRVLHNRLANAITEDDEKRETLSLITQFTLFLESLM